MIKTEQGTIQRSLCSYNERASRTCCCGTWYWVKQRVSWGMFLTFDRGPQMPGAKRGTDLPSQNTFHVLKKNAAVEVLREYHTGAHSN